MPAQRVDDYPPRSQKTGDDFAYYLQASQRNYGVVVLPHRSGLILPPSCVDCREMQFCPRDLSQEESNEQSISHRRILVWHKKRITVVIVSVALLGLALCAGVAMALLVGTGR